MQETIRIAHNLRIQRLWHRVAGLARVVGNLISPIHGQQKRVEIQIIEMRSTAADLAQQICTPNHVIHGACADLGQHFADFLRVEGDQVHHLVCVPCELAAQTFILRAHAYRAGVGLALAHHDAAHSDQGGGTDAVFLCPHHGSHHDVTPCAQAPIRSQRHPFAQLVHRQHLVRFGQAHFPRQARIFDRGGRRGPRAAIMARDQDHIRLSLGHTGRDCAHTGRRHQLHRHLAARIDLLEVIDQLRKVFDRVDIVVRRR